MLTRRAPARLIANNAGVEGEVIVEALMGLSFEMGYNAMDDRWAQEHPMYGRTSNLTL